MKALILAAGRGRRLWPFTSDRPKCLLQVGGISLLQRQLSHLECAGVASAVIVCGFGVERMRQTVSSLDVTLPIKLLYNPFYAISDNLISLWAARGEMDGECLLLNGDNIFHPNALDEIKNSSGDCCLLAARKSSYDADAMKLSLCGHRVTHISKELDSASAEAESLGVLRFSAAGSAIMRDALEEIVVEDSALSSHFPLVLQHLIDRGYDVSCRMTKSPCSDVDNPADLSRVRKELHIYSQEMSPLAYGRAGGQR